MSESVNGLRDGRRLKSHPISFGSGEPVTSSPMGNGRSPESQHNVLRFHILQCSKADDSELETAIRP